MTSQPEFDCLRQACSSALAEFFAFAHETESRMRHLHLPVGVEEDVEFLCQRGVEFDAFHVYLVASRQLADFVQRHMYATIN
jgi:hypothetical protein